MRDDELFTVWQVACELEITSRCVRRWIKEGKLAVIRIRPRMLRIRGSEINRLLAAGFCSARDSRSEANLNKSI